MARVTMAAPTTVTGSAKPVIPLWTTGRRILSAAFRWLTARSVVQSDPLLKVLIIRRDDRLLKDAGLAPEDVMGRWRHFRERELEPALRRPPRR